MVSPLVMSQTIINGDFEINTAGFDQINMTNAAFTATMSNAEAFGSTPNMDIITSNTYCGFPQNGNWHVAFTGGGTDAISLDLSSPLVAGNTYAISYYDRGCSSFPTFPSQIGVSNSSNTVGTIVYTSPAIPQSGNWNQRSFTFVAPFAANYITVSGGGPTNTSSWIQIDNVQFDCAMNVDLGADTLICAGNNVLLDATNPSSTYLWQDGSTNATFNVTQSGTYYVDVTNSCGTASDTIVVSVDPLPIVDLGNDTLLCAGSSLLLDASNPGATYLWQDGSTAATFSASSANTYYVDVTNNCGTATDTIVIINGFPPTVNLGNDTTICPNTPLQLDVTSPFATYLWQDGATAGLYNVTSAGTYFVDVTNACGTSSDTIAINSYTLPVVSLGNDTSLCNGQSLILDVTNNGTTYLWQDGSTNATFNVTTSGTYFVDVTSNCGVFTDTINVNYVSPPTVDLGNDTSLCFNTPYLLSPSVSGVSYLWQDNSTGPTYTTTQSGIYWVTVSNACGSATDSVSILYDAEINVDLGNDTVLCDGAQLQLSVNAPNSIIEWSNQSSGNSMNVDSSGTYHVAVTVGACTARDTIIIETNELPNPDLGNDRLICEDDKLVLSTQDNEGSHYWSTGSSEAAILVDDFGEYWVAVTNSCGTSLDTIVIGDMQCSCEMYFPNTFTPDGDEFNQVFRAYYTCDLYSYNLRIYNRWGQLLFTSNDPDAIWDGTYNGELVQNGTYIYLVEYENDYSIVKRLEGHVNVLH